MFNMYTSWPQLLELLPFFLNWELGANVWWGAVDFALNAGDWPGENHLAAQRLLERMFLLAVPPPLPMVPSTW